MYIQTSEGLGQPSKMGADVTLLVSFSMEGFRTTKDFRDAFAKHSAAGRMGPARGMFRKLFCEADHYEVDRVINGKPITNNVAVVWGYPMVYSLKGGQKPLLGKIAPKGWHLSQVGRSVSPPPLCPSPPPVPVPKPLPVPKPYELTVYFSPPSSYKIRAGDEAKILNWYSVLPSPTRMKIKSGKLPLVVEGYASTTQPADKNKELSEKRAHQVIDILKKVAGTSAKFVVYPYGESKALTRDEVEDPKERRVRISVTDN